MHSPPVDVAQLPAESITSSSSLARCDRSTVIQLFITVADSIRCVTYTSSTP